MGETLQAAPGARAGTPSAVRRSGACRRSVRTEVRAGLGRGPLARPAIALALGLALLAPRAGRADGPQRPADPGAEARAASKPASRHTVALSERLRAELPFDDGRDFEEAKRGFLGAPASTRITAEDGHVVWDMGAYRWLLEGRDEPSIHPSLRRQAVLNMAYGLYEVVPERIYQVRGFDLANLTLVRGENGWIVLDTLTTRETAAAAMAFVRERLGERPVVAVVYSHSHVDHFGGVRGVVDEKRVASGAVRILAPRGFLEHAVAENVYAGTAMYRRAMYQYGILLPRGPRGHVDQAIGKAVARGTPTLIAPTDVIEKDLDERTIDGVRMVFQNTPGTEAPAEMNVYFPQWKALFAAENVVATIHNIYTLRGALVRDALEWSRQINRALHLFGEKAEVMFTAHNWPRWGNARIQEVMRAQRDAYANLNNGVLHLANQGVTIAQIHNVYLPPRSLRRLWAARSYHGSVGHNARAVLNRYLGYWDGDPATLLPLSPEESAPLYVEMMGGAERILAKARELAAAGRYRYAQEILDKLVHAEPGNRAAKDLLADVFEQLGYQQESASVRDVYLAAAHELRVGMPRRMPAQIVGPDLVRAMTTQQWLDYLAIRLDSAKAEGKGFVLNLVTPDTKERFVVELSNATLTSIEGFQAKDADLTLTIARPDLLRVLMGATSLDDVVEAGRATAVGDRGVLATLLGLLSDFDPGFEILPGTAPPGGLRSARRVPDEAGGSRAGADESRSRSHVGLPGR